MDKNTTYQTGNTAATKFESLVNRFPPFESQKA